MDIAAVTRLIRLAWMLTCLMGLGCSEAAMARGEADDVSRRMGSGVNILGYDGIWEGGTDAPFRQRYFGMIYKAGFRHVRINLYAFKYLDDKKRLDPNFLDRLDWVIEQSIAAGLIPVIDEHDFEICQQDTPTCRGNLEAFWSQVGKRYAGKHPEAVFEILNEPGGNMSLGDWNDIVARVLTIMRQTNPKRTIIVAALNTEGPIGERIPQLPSEDRNLIVTVHYYRPMTFTHQGAPWAPEFRSPAPVQWGTPQDEEALTNDFSQVANWAKTAGRPIYLGEFGVYDKAPTAARARYVGFVTATAKRLGWPWAFWQFDHDFALYDTDRERWNGPLLRALLPPPARPQR